MFLNARQSSFYLPVKLMKRRRLISVACLCFGILTQAAQASVFDTYGLGPAAVAIGNANTAGGPSAYAAYSNPALLVKSQHNELATSLLYTHFKLQDLPNSQQSHLPRSLEPNNKARDIEGGSLGLNLKLSDHLNFGLAAYLPTGAVGRIKGLSPYEASYLRLAEQQQKPAIYTALAVEGPAGFAIGFGAYYSLKARGLLQVSLDSKESEGRFDLVLDPVVVPYLGLSWTAGDWVIGALYRQAQETESAIESSFAFSTDTAMLPFDASTQLVPFYDPALTRLGAAWQKSKLRLSASIERASWRNFKAPLVQISGADVAALSMETRYGENNLRDTYAFRIGSGWQFEQLELLAGLEAHSSANAPNRPSYVIDPERRSVSMGSRFQFQADRDGRRLSLEGAYQYSRLSRVSSLTPKGMSIKLDASSNIQSWLGGLAYVL